MATSKKEVKKTEAPAKEAAAEEAEEAEEAEGSASKQGAAIVLSNGERRVDYIHRRYYDDDVKRGDIAKELSELQGKKIPYQIVFAATKGNEEARLAKKAERAAKKAGK